MEIENQKNIKLLRDIEFYKVKLCVKAEEGICVTQNIENLGSITRPLVILVIHDVPLDRFILAMQYQSSFNNMSKQF